MGKFLKTQKSEKVFHYYLMQSCHDKVWSKPKYQRCATMKDVAMLGNFEDCYYALRWLVSSKHKIRLSSDNLEDFQLYLLLIRTLKLSPEKLQRVAGKALEKIFREILKQKEKVKARGVPYKEYHPTKKRIFVAIDKKGRIQLPKHIVERLEVNGAVPSTVPLTLDEASGVMIIGYLGDSGHIQVREEVFECCSKVTSAN